jgi:hypothetical protein
MLCRSAARSFRRFTTSLREKTVAAAAAAAFPHRVRRLSAASRRLPRRLASGGRFQRAQLRHLLRHAVPPEALH